MNAKNVVLTVAVIVLALLVGVAGYFLFVERGKIGQLSGAVAIAINATSQALDNAGGTNYAKGLSARELVNSDSKEFKAKTKKFNTQIEQNVENRNKMATTLSQIAQRSGSEEKLDSNLKDADKAEDAAKRVLKAFNRAIKNRNANYKEIQSIAKENFGVELDVEKLKKGDVTALQELKTAIRAAQDRTEDYNKILGQLAMLAESSPTPKDVADAVKKAKSGTVTNADELERLKNDTAAKQNTSATNVTIIAEQNKKIQTLDETIKGFKLNGKEIPSDGSVEVRKNWRGKILKINNELSYAVVNLGTQTTVEEKFGEVMVQVSPKVMVGTSLKVLRNNKEVTKLKVKLISKTICVADLAELNVVQVGDVVCFDIE